MFFIHNTLVQETYFVNSQKIVKGGAPKPICMPRRLPQAVLTQPDDLLTTDADRLRNVNINRQRAWRAAC
jgi:hypothetical protein